MSVLCRLGLHWWYQTLGEDVVPTCRVCGNHKRFTKRQRIRGEGYKQGVSDERREWARTFHGVTDPHEAWRRTMLEGVEGERKRIVEMLRGMLPKVEPKLKGLRWLIAKIEEGKP